MECACPPLVKKRSRSPGPIEAGPIRVSTAQDMGTRWSAILFTLVVALGLLFAFENAPAWMGISPTVHEASAASP